MNQPAFAFYDEPDAMPVLEDVDTYLIMISGGKDGLSCLLHLLELGVPKEKIELWHHSIDGREDSTLMDWPVTEAYCKALAAEFELPLYFSWRDGGMEREMLRDQTMTAPVHFEVPGGAVQNSGGTTGSLGTRRKFPQVAASLTTRWCSAYLKIMVAAAAITNQPRFLNKYTVVVTGERAQESSSRARYKVLEPHRTSNGRRRVDHWRPVHRWSEEQIWACIQRNGIVPHPAYMLGWGRVSCAACIFGSKHQWRSLSKVLPEQYIKIVNYESEFGTTIQRTHSVPELAAAGTAYEMDADTMALARSKVYDRPIRVSPALWKLPQGAYGEKNGPV